MILNELKNKRVLILGFGREGIDNFRFLRKLFPKKVFGVGDRLKLSELSNRAKKVIKPDKKVKLHLGKNYLKSLKNYDLIIKSPGIPPKEILSFLKKGQKITSQTEIFFENCPGKIIGITGTKGKSTTASLIYQILKKGVASKKRTSPLGRGLKVHLVGNIGKPVLQLLFSATKKDVYVYELSSHQLLNLKKSPGFAVFLNLYPEHLDYYKDFKEYISAKANVTRYQTKKDYLIFNSRDKIVREIAKKSKAKKVPINTKSIEKIIKIKDIPLKGKFNLQNVAATIEIGKIFGISSRDIALAIKKFKPLPHRLEFIGKFKDIKFYNDSLSTIPETTILAMEALGENIQTIILGGFERNQDFKKLVKKILNSKIKTVISFPTTGERIWNNILQQKKGRLAPKYFLVNNMRETVKLAYQYTSGGKICLLSCASPSFGIFRDYKERGNLFKKYVKKYAKKP
ncbi:UDP-N-acetylmuramoyl-L-alanine--D-glutamate ligase [Patescibacteria group bacterium]|nr:UDP-N-acetylmuramoyl-L-alanine--D-glutamate ligase [Patescibacteria group bacterium]